MIEREGEVQVRNMSLSLCICDNWRQEAFGISCIDFVSELLIGVGILYEKVEDCAKGNGGCVASC